MTILRSTLPRLTWRTYPLAAALLLAGTGLLYAGCSSDDQGATSQVLPPIAGVGGALPASACEFGGPDGTCNPAREGCECEDCAYRALCAGGCTDDGSCAIGDSDNPGPEDCSCSDCWQKVVACAPRHNGCDLDAGCQSDEACTCPDCTTEPSCQGTCVDNGECVPSLEGCACSDCASDDFCLNPPTGNGGSGGVGGAGGAAAGGAAAGGAGGA